MENEKIKIFGYFDKHLEVNNFIPSLSVDHLKKTFPEIDITQLVEFQSEWRKSRQVQFEERNKRIACLVLQGRTYDDVGIDFDISRERVYQITRKVCEHIDPEISGNYDIKKLRKDSGRLINRIKGAVTRYSTDS
jgi:hypothetical protein